VALVCKLKPESLSTLPQVEYFAANITGNGKLEVLVSDWYSITDFFKKVRRFFSLEFRVFIGSNMTNTYKIFKFVT